MDQPCHFEHVGLQADTFFVECVIVRECGFRWRPGRGCGRSGGWICRVRRRGSRHARRMLRRRRGAAQCAGAGRGAGTRKTWASAVIMSRVDSSDRPASVSLSSWLMWATFNASAGAAAGNFCAEPATMFPFCRHDSELLAVMVLCCNVSLFSTLLDRGARESEAENGRVNRDSGEGTAACAGRIRAAESERSSYRRRHVIIVLKSILSRFFDVRIVCSLIG